MDEKDLIIQKLIDRIATLEKLVEQQAAVIAAQSARIVELERRLNKNSSNSSISTARKQGWNIFESIKQVFQGYVPMPT